jgi:hypothetical protein
MNGFPSRELILFYKEKNNATYQEIDKALQKLKRRPLQSYELISVIFKMRHEQLQKKFKRGDIFCYTVCNNYKIIEKDGYVYYQQ